MIRAHERQKLAELLWIDRRAVGERAVLATCSSVECLPALAAGRAHHARSRPKCVSYQTAIHPVNWATKRATITSRQVAQPGQFSTHFPTMHISAKTARVYSVSITTWD